MVLSAPLTLRGGGHLSHFLEIGEKVEKSLEILDKDVKEMLGSLPTSMEITFEDGEEVYEPVVHSPVVEVSPATPMTSLETKIAEEYSMGKSTRAIAEGLGISPKTVRDVLGKPHIKVFVNDLINAQYVSSVEGRLRIVHRIVDAKLEKLEEEYDGDFSNATKKDIVDLLVIADGMLKERQKKELGVSDNVYMNIVNQITGK